MKRQKQILIFGELDAERWLRISQDVRGICGRVSIGRMLGRATAGAEENALCISILSPGSDCRQGDLRDVG
ncbi:MAG: hypothetical protein ACYS9C_03815 [Planctomycetota bacterium]